MLASTPIPVDYYIGQLSFYFISQSRALHMWRGQGRNQLIFSREEAKWS